MNTTKTSLRPLSSRLTSANRKNFAESLQNMKNLIEKLSIDKQEKEIS
jgi:hypothetical protein